MSHLALSSVTPMSGPPVRPARGLRTCDVSRHVAARVLLDHVSVAFAPGELVAIIGVSGAGKTTLLETLAGLRRPTTGTVTLDGVDIGDAPTRHRIGCVPQDDIIHLDLPLRRTLLHAARLRLPTGTAAEQRGAAVERVLRELDLAHRGDVRVRDLSGGQRKRASIAVELLTHPDVLLLDEPTSGLDPATAAEVLRVLREVADRGTTVLLTSHAPADVRSCDRVVVLAAGGLLAYDGPPLAALDWFDVDELDELHAVVAESDPLQLADRFAAVADRQRDEAPQEEPEEETSPGTTWAARMAGPGRQLLTLTRRSAELMVRTRSTAAVLVGSPTLVIVMLTVLFRPGGLVRAAGSAITAVQLVYWIAFAGFFFGLTYGLLQIVTESAILRRERSWGSSLGAYVGSKLLVLLPLLVGVDVSLFAVLRVTDRLPAADASTWTGLAIVFLLDATAGLALGLLASALVTNAAQATLALPMLCFPQVLFAGAMVPVSAMTSEGRAISAAMSNRWAFEALGRTLDLDGRFGSDPGGLGEWVTVFHGDASTQVAALAGMVVLCLVATVGVLHRRTAAR